MLKSVSWRIIGIVLLYTITWLITYNLVITTIIIVHHHVAFIFIYYFHERFWERYPDGGKAWFKAFTYEICLGFLVLGVITWVVTGSWRQVSNITVSYLAIRYFGYPIHEWLYARFYRRREAH